MYHHVVAQLLFAAFCVRRDIQTAVAFLTTCVKAPDEDDWVRLKQVMKHLKGMKRSTITLRADSFSIIKWWVYAAFASYHDCRGHSGGMMSLGAEQRINGKIPTDNERIAVDNFMGPVLNTMHFMEAQGHNVTYRISCFRTIKATRDSW